MTRPATAGATAGTTLAPRRRHAGRTVLRELPLLPAFILLAAFMLGPIVYALYGSLTNRTMSGYRAAAPEFVGLDNYVNLLTDPNFLKSVLLTTLFLFASAIVGQNVLGMFVAVLMRHCPKPVASVVGATIVGAWVMPEIVAAFACYAFFSSEGTLNSILAAVPPEVKESAQIDGANAVQTFFRISLPMIRRTVATNLMLTTLQTLGVFTLIWVMTGGGPGTDSATLPVLAYQEAFKFSQVGYGTAIATVTLVVGAIFSTVYMRVLKPEVD